MKKLKKNNKNKNYSKIILLIGISFVFIACCITPALNAAEYKKRNECTISSPIKQEIKGICIIEGGETGGEIDSKLTTPDGEIYHLERHLIKIKGGNESEKYLIDNRRVLYTNNNCGSSWKRVGKLLRRHVITD